MTAPTTSARTGPPAGLLLNEAASAGRENLDAAHVERYDGKEDAAASEEVELLCTLGLAANSMVVDLGAGTGQFTLAVATYCRRVVAIDVSPVMLDRLRTNVADQQLGNVEMIRAGFRVEQATYSEDGIFARYLLRAV